MSNRIKEVASEEAERLKTLSVQAVHSGAYLYPFRGMAYFLTHRSLQKPLFSSLLPTLTLGLVTTVTLFVVLYLPQAAVLAFTQGPFAAVSAALLVLSESSTLSTFLGRQVFISDALIDTFDATLLTRGGTDKLVAEGRQVRPGSDPISKLGKIVKRPFERLAPKAIIRYLMYLPLNFIPVVGTVLFVILQGRRAGPAAQERYFQLKGWRGEQKQHHIEKYQAAYTRCVCWMGVDAILNTLTDTTSSFGVLAVLLEMIPVAGIFFAFTNTVSAALWAADMEKHEVDEQGTSPELRQNVKKSE